jgi:hypothetical protein
MLTFGNNLNAAVLLQFRGVLFAGVVILNLRRLAADDETSASIHWLERNTQPVSRLAKPDILRAVLAAIGSKLDGSPAATSTAGESE